MLLNPYCFKTHYCLLAFYLPLDYNQTNNRSTYFQYILTSDSFKHNNNTYNISINFPIRTFPLFSFACPSYQFLSLFILSSILLSLCFAFNLHYCAALCNGWGPSYILSFFCSLAVRLHTARLPMMLGSHSTITYLALQIANKTQRVMQTKKIFFTYAHTAWNYPGWPD
jgi:hypothetical protein